MFFSVRGFILPRGLRRPLARRVAMASPISARVVKAILLWVIGGEMRGSGMCVVEG